MKTIIQKGFTLIELMIVVAIIGILAAIAIPAYQDYVARGQMSEAMTLASGLKINVQDVYAQESNCVDNSAGANHGVSQNIDISGRYVAKITTSTATEPDGVCQIVATLKATNIASGIAGQTLTLTMTNNPAGAVTWRCSSTAQPKYLPAACR